MTGIIDKARRSLLFGAGAIAGFFARNAPGQAMPAPVPAGKQQYFFPGTSRPLAGGKLYTYAAGTSTLKPTYQDAAGSIPNTNPVTLDATGSARIYWTGSYKLVLEDALGNTIYTVDNYVTDQSAIALSNLASPSGAGQIGYQAPGTGTVPSTVHSKLAERKSFWDFLTPEQIADTQKAQPVLDLSVPLQTARDWLASSRHPTDRPNATLVFPAGIYRYSLSPNWAIDNATIVNDGAVYFQYFGTGTACIIDADGYGRVNMKFGRFIIQAPPTAKDGVLVRQIHHSDMYLTVKGAGRASAGINVLGCVLTKFHRPTVSNVEYGWYLGAQPRIGIYIGANKMIGNSAANQFDNPICEGLSDTGISIVAGDANIFLGGTSESNAGYGIRTAYGSSSNRFIGTDFEANKTSDALISGFGNVLSMCSSSSSITFANGADGNIVTGGFYDKVIFQAGSLRNVIDDCFVNRNNAGSWLTNDGKNFIGKCIDRTNGTVGIPYAKATATTTTSSLSIPNNTLQTMVVYLDNTIHRACELVAPDKSLTRSQVGQVLVFPGYTVNVHFASAAGGSVTYVYV